MKREETFSSGEIKKKKRGSNWSFFESGGGEEEEEEEEGEEEEEEAPAGEPGEVNENHPNNLIMCPIPPSSCLSLTSRRHAAHASYQGTL